jgi:hypothetical protein
LQNAICKKSWGYYSEVTHAPDSTRRRVALIAGHLILRHATSVSQLVTVRKSAGVALAALPLRSPATFEDEQTLCFVGWGSNSISRGQGKCIGKSETGKESGIWELKKEVYRMK